MARVRSINPGFFMDDELAEVQPLGRLLFAGLWCCADREGRLKDRPRRIKSETLPYDDAEVEELLGQLAARGFIYRYVVDNSAFIAIPSWHKYQNPHHKEAVSVIPEPTGQAWSKLESSTGQAWSKHGSSMNHAQANHARSSSSSSSHSSRGVASPKDKNVCKCGAELQVPGDGTDTLRCPVCEPAVIP